MASTYSNLDSADYAQIYGVNIDNINSTNSGTYGQDSIVLIDSSGEGVISGVFPVSHKYAGTTGFLTSRSTIRTVDLLGEGEIGGIVSGEWIPTGDTQEGQIGWTTGEFKPYSSTNPESWLRSIYLNDTPIVNSNGYYNFQAVEAAITVGTPSGITSDDPAWYGSNDPIEKTRTISERLRGPDVGQQDANELHYYPKVYRFFNDNLQSIRVNIKIPALSYTKVASDPNLTEGTWPDSEVGQVRASQLIFKYRYRPIYKDKLGNSDLTVNRQWYGVGGAGNTQSVGKPLTSIVRGLIRSAYIHDYTIPLDQDLVNDKLIGWEIEVVRTTLDSIESHIVNQSFVENITEISNDTLSYPNSAIASLKFDAEYFSQIPNRSYDLKLLKVKIPSGYDPDAKKYSGSAWDGTFQDEKKWTDNPAWIFYDLLTNKRYGVGKYLGDVQVDKWTLYEIAKFCDQLVSDGQGGYEPRFTCNVLINTREEAFKVIKDFASVFRSMAYYGFGRVNVSCDKPRDEIALYNNANIVDGNFTYSSTSKQSIPTVCYVRYNDKENMHKPAVEYVENTEGIRKYGVVEKEVTAFACTSRSQAIRMGRWILSTEIEQTETVSFATGPEAILLRPGDLVRVIDQNRSETNYAGRTVSGASQSLILDRTVSLDSSSNYSLTLTTPSYFYDESIVDVTSQTDQESFRNAHVQTFDFSPATAGITISNVAISGSSEPSGTKISYTGDMFSSAGKDIVNESTWSITKLDQKSNNLYSVISTKENAGNLTFNVEAMLHNESKYGYLESGIVYSYVKSPQNITAAPPAPASITTSVLSHPDSPHGDTKRIKIKVNNPDPIGTTIGYKIYVYQGSSWTGQTVGATNVPKSQHLFDTIYLTDVNESGDPYTFYIPSTLAGGSGTFVIRVYAINSVGTLSNDKKDATETVSDHFPIKDVQVHSLRLASKYAYNETRESTSITSANKESFLFNDNKDAEFQWSIEFLNEATFNLPITYKVSIHEPSDTSALPGTQLESYTVNDKIFNFTFAKNRVMPGGVRRRYDVVVQAVDSNGVTSSGVNAGTYFGWDIMEVLNPKPTGYYLTPRVNNYSTVGPQQACDALYTDQYIDSDGFVNLDFIGNSLPDIAGGYAYVSKQPFSGADFKNDGSPKTPAERTGEGRLSIGDSELFKTGEYQISETNFEVDGGGLLNSSDAKITFKPSLTGEFSPPYYMALKLYDSFDKEIKDNSLNSTWNSGLLNKESSPNKESNGLWLGFARDTTGAAGNIFKSFYQLSTGTSGSYLGDPDQGTPKCNTSGTFPTPLYPTKYYGANQGGFKYWIRINVNGQWEGQGISHVKVLTQKDVMTLYDYRGFYEYACKIKDYAKLEQADGDNDEYLLYPNAYHYTAYPNHPESFAQCKFRTAQADYVSLGYEGLDPNNALIQYDTIFNRSGVGTAPQKFFGGTTSYYAYPLFEVAGATLHNDLTGIMQRIVLDPDDISGPPLVNGYFLDYELRKAGIAKDYTQLLHLADADGDDYDPIPSYNERGQAIGGKTRPLRGFRRFRVYFDENNLPQPNDPSGLASYAVMGVNCWNGEYESWPAPNSLESFQGNTGDGAGAIDYRPPASHFSESLLFAKDGYGVFPSSVLSYMESGDLFENIPGVWNHHPAGFGQGFGGLVKTQKYFDVHLGRMIDDSYLNEGFFGVITTNNYGISSQNAFLPSHPSVSGIDQAVFYNQPYVTKTVADGGDGSGEWTEFV